MALTENDEPAHNPRAHGGTSYRCSLPGLAGFEGPTSPEDSGPALAPAYP